MSPREPGGPRPGPDPFDEALLRRIRAGDLQALERLVERKRERALRLARHVVGNDDDAKDVAQMAFIRVWRNLGDYRQGSGFDPWFHRIVMNLAIDFRRRAAARRRGLEGLAGESSVRRASGPSEGSLARDEVSRIFDDLSRDLPPQQRAVFALREVEGMDTEEVARALGVRPSTVRNHLFQARRTLQRLMRERYPEYVPGGRRP